MNRIAEECLARHRDAERTLSKPEPFKLSATTMLDLMAEYNCVVVPDTFYLVPLIIEEPRTLMDRASLSLLIERGYKAR
jgi:hypothetical protein